MILATVIIYQCDNCPTVISLKSAEDWRTFEALWHNGRRYEFCPQCRFTPAAQKIIALDSTEQSQPMQMMFADGLEKAA